MEIPKQLNSEIQLYCKANKIEDVDLFIIKMIKQGFTIEKYGSEPVINSDVKFNQTTDKIIENKKDLYGE
jgi:hypothetical protein